MKKLTYLNSILIILVVGSVFGWMITEISRGEIAEYNKRLIITALDIDVRLYELIDDEYILVETPELDLTNLAPGDKRHFKFEVDNNNTTVSTSKIVFSDITGDIDDLKEKIYIGSTSPEVKEFYLSERLEAIDLEYIIRFYDLVEAPAGITTTIYWYLGMDSTASNEVAEKELSVDSINFVKP